MDIKKHFIVHDEKPKYELFLAPYQITFFLAFGQGKVFFSYHILMNILIYIFRDKEISQGEKTKSIFWSTGKTAEK